MSPHPARGSLLSRLTRAQPPLLLPPLLLPLALLVPPPNPPRLTEDVLVPLEPVTEEPLGATEEPPLAFSPTVPEPP